MVAHTSSDPNVRAEFETFVRSSSIDVLLLEDANYDVLSRLKDDQSSDDVQRFTSRRRLYFDEIASLSIIIISSTFSVEDFARLVPHLELTVVAHATDALPEARGVNVPSASGKFDLSSKSILAAQDFTSLTRHGKTYAAWTVQLQLPRPRAKIQRPAIYFSASIMPRKPAITLKGTVDEDSLQSWQTQPANVLQPLMFDPALFGKNTYLSEDQITKVAPSTPSIDTQVRPLRGASKSGLPIWSAIISRVRFSVASELLIASLHIETSSLVPGSIALDKLSVLSDEAETKVIYENLPNLICAGDEVVLMYAIYPPGPVADLPRGFTALLKIEIEAKIWADHGSNSYLRINFQTPFDFSRLTEPTTYRWTRPLSTSSQLKRLSAQSATKPSVSFELPPSFSGLNDEGILFNFTVPPIIILNSTLAVNVQCINRGSRLRRFGIVVIPSVKTNSTSQQSLARQSKGEEVSPIATTVNGPTPERPISRALVQLNPDIRIGPLSPGACYETKMEFRILASGVWELGIFRLVDLDTGRAVDLREIPSVICFEPVKERGVPGG